MRFYLGTHRPHWLRLAGVPLFVSRRTLTEYREAPQALGPWALDSGGFSELKLYGRWLTLPKTYIDEVRRWREEIGNLEWAAIQDWMCEPFMLGRTGLTIKEHQQRTCDSYGELTYSAGDVPWVPVLQGWHPDEYLDHLAMYDNMGFRLREAPLVGVGSVCRRQGTEEALEVLRPLAAEGLRLHGFGFKVDGLWQGASHLLASADSMAWSKAARYEPPLPGCKHKTCNNCLVWALQWRERVLRACREEYQGVLSCSL